MKLMISSSFYTEFTLYETTKPEELKKWFTLAITGKTTEDPDPKYHKLIGFQEDTETQDAINQADEIVFDFELVDLPEAEEKCLDTPEFWDGLKVATENFGKFADFMINNRDAVQELIGILPVDMSLIDDGIDNIKDVINDYHM